MENGEPRYATAVGRSDVAAGWRDRREESGIVIDAQTDEIMADGLTMPHSPCLHDVDLYLINAGTGDLGRLDRETGTFEPIAFCPGFGRGLTFHEDTAIVGLSKPRGDEVFQDLPLGDRLREKGANPRCGLCDRPDERQHGALADVYGWDRGGTVGRAGALEHGAPDGAGL